MRRALVTGAGHGIGEAIALALVKDGCAVAAHYRSTPPKSANEMATTVQGDLLVPGEADRVVREGVDFLGGLDILVCNAGHLVGRVAVADMSDEHYFKVMDVNLGTTFRTVRAAIPHLKRGARVITMSSLAAHNGGGAGSAVYAAAKAAVRGLTKGLAKELGPVGVTVNALAPGFIGGTAFHGTFTPPNVQETIVSGVPLKRAGSPEEVASAVVWLASDGAGYVTGATIDIDGGAWFR